MRSSLMRHPGHLSGRAHLDQAHRALRGVGERVRDEGVRALSAGGLVEHRLEYGATTCGNSPRLYAVQRVSWIAVGVHVVEHRAHDVKVAREARAGVHYEQPHPVAHVNVERGLLILERPTVEHDVARLTVERPLPVGLPWERAVAALHVELALHDHELLLHLARPDALAVP